jgi:hypothetical protein
MTDTSLRSEPPQECTLCHRPMVYSKIRCTVCDKQFHVDCIAAHGHRAELEAANRRIAEMEKDRC